MVDRLRASMFTGSSVGGVALSRVEEEEKGEETGGGDEGAADAYWDGEVESERTEKWWWFGASAIELGFDSGYRDEK